MKHITLLLLSIIVISCTSGSNHDIKKYFDQVNQAELNICKGQFDQASKTYQAAFSEILKPFGKDLYNAALCAQLSDRLSDRDQYLQTIINNTNDFDFVKSKFVNTYLTQEEWQNLIANRQIDYSPRLRKDFKAIRDRDQLYRPMYDTHDDIINENRILNLERLFSISDSIGFPSQIELGFKESLRGQNHHIVLLHTAQRRSRDKSVLDLEPILFNAIHEGRLDPELGIFYMNYQNDKEKGIFETYATTQITHPLLPDSLNTKVWLPNLTDEQINQANNKRQKWLANSLDDIATKSDYLSRSSRPFIFTSVKKSIGNLRDDFDKETALEQYKMGTSFRKEYKKQTKVLLDKRSATNHYRIAPINNCLYYWNKCFPKRRQ